MSRQLSLSVTVPDPGDPGYAKYQAALRRYERLRAAVEDVDLERLPDLEDELERLTANRPALRAAYEQFRLRPRRRASVVGPAQGGSGGEGGEKRGA